MPRRLGDLARRLLLGKRGAVDKYGRYVSPCAQERSFAHASVGIFPGQNFRMEVSLLILLTYRQFMSKLSSDSDNPMTCGFVYENRENCMNRGHFGGLRQKLGNDRALIMVGVFENSPPNKKDPRARTRKRPRLPRREAGPPCTAHGSGALACLRRACRGCLARFTHPFSCCS